MGYGSMVVKKPSKKPLQIFVGEPAPPRPEKLEKASASHSGRTFQHLHHVRPPTHGRRGLLGSGGNAGDEEQLLYVALCRDKLAEHQAMKAKEQEKQDKILKRASLIAQATRALQTPPPDQEDPTPGPAETSIEMPSLVATMCEGSSATANEAPEASQDRELHKLEQWLTQRGTAVPGRVQSKPRAAVQSGADAAGPAGKSGASGKADVHVSAVRAVGGASDEYLENKRLGKLYMQWREQQDDSDDDFEPARTMTEKSMTRRGTAGHAPAARRATDKGLASTAGGKLSPSPPSQGSASKTSGRQTPASDAASNAPKENVPMQDGRDKSEQKFKEYQSMMTEKIFQAVTVDEQATSSGKPVKQIEGFPTLNLMRLYQGPWRLNH